MGHTTNSRTWSPPGGARRDGRRGGRPHDAGPSPDRGDQTRAEDGGTIPPPPLIALPAPRELLDDWPPRPAGRQRFGGLLRRGATDDKDQLARRRQLLVGAGGVAAGAAVLWVAKGTPPFGDDGPPAPPTGPREAASQPNLAAAYGSRDESYVADAPPAPPPGETMLFASASEAAAATRVTNPTILATDRPILHLLRRATFGPTPALVDEVETKGIDAWLDQQLDPTSIPDPTADLVWAAFPRASMDHLQIQANLEKYAWYAMSDYASATLARQVWSRRQLYEVMVDFWANHLHVPIPHGAVWDVGPNYHNEVIRRHALGSFTDMLLASARHPAMLRYLNNSVSQKDSVNENYGRELLELHTVGVGSGYTEDDVRNSAYILTGRTTNSDDGRVDGSGQFVYKADQHWTGSVRVLGFQHPNDSADGGFDVGDAYLRYLAAHPSTAQTIARKLAVRLVADNPPQTLVDRLATTYLENGTAIRPVLDVLFRSRETWAAVGAKTRRPLENYVATLRILDVQPGTDTAKGVHDVYWGAEDLGHKPLAWEAPNGYPDVQAAWRSASGTLATWNRHWALVDGWYGGLTYHEPEALVAGRPAATVGEYVDSLCERLCFQRFQPQHRDVLFLYVGADPATPAGTPELARTVGPLAALILDSPYFALR